MTHLESRGAETFQQQEGASSLPLTCRADAQEAESNVQRDVVLRAEYAAEVQLKVVIVGVQVAVWIATAGLALEFAYKLAKDDSSFIQSPTLFICNLIVAAICTAATSACLIILAHRIVSTKLKEQKWSKRRANTVAINLALCAVQFVNSTCLLVANSYVLGTDCQWFSHVVIWLGWGQWTCWNTYFLLQLVQAHNFTLWTGSHAIWWTLWLFTSNGKPSQGNDIIVEDAPWYIHMPKLTLWVAFEACVTPRAVIDSRRSYTPSHASASPNPCAEWSYDCQLPASLVALACTSYAIWILYLLAWTTYIFRAVRALHTRPYADYRRANIDVRFQVAYLACSAGVTRHYYCACHALDLTRSRRFPIAFYLATIIVTYFINLNSCATFLETFLGLSPAVLVATASVLANCYMYMPKHPDTDSVLQVWLQAWAWTEVEKPAELAYRNAHLPHNEELHSEPMFCFETALKCWYWSQLVYRVSSGGKLPLHVGSDADAPSGEPFNLQTGLALFGLKEFDLLIERSLNTKVLMGWSDTTMVIAFQGTANLVNVRADLEGWITQYPRDNRRRCFQPRPGVHAGFLKTWQANGIDRRIVQRICDWAQAGRAAPECHPSVYFTGHSLGGAFATLAAFDVLRSCSSSLGPDTMSVYTFGAPRTGNARFMVMYNHLLPDTWQIINDQDAVPRSAKFFIYKRPGHAVLINRYGDLIVRPTFIEATAQRVPCRRSIAQHMLGAYQRSLVALIRGQASELKRVERGVEGVAKLVASAPLRRMLTTTHSLQDEFMETIGRPVAAVAGGVGAAVQEGLDAVRQTVLPDAGSDDAGDDVESGPAGGILEHAGHLDSTGTPEVTQHADDAAATASGHQQSVSEPSVVVEP